MPLRETGPDTLRLLALLVAAALVALAERRMRTASQIFDAKASPFNVALVRIAVFATLLGPAIASSNVILLVACVLGISGLFTRTAAWIAVALGIGIGGAGWPILWAAALLTVAPCADVLAFDAIPDAWRRADGQSTAPPLASSVYGAALRMLSLVALLGLVAGPWPPRGFHLWSLFVLLLALPDWAKGLRWAGNRMFKTPLAIVYDGDCGFCRRAVATLRTLDVLGRIDWTSSKESARVRALGLSQVADSGEIEHFTAVFPGGVAEGYDAYRRLTKRIPLFWPLLPVLASPPVVAWGRATYTRVEAARPGINPEPLSPRPATTRLGIWLVGAGILAAVVTRLMLGL